MPGLRLDAGGWGQKGGSCAKGKTIKFILRAKEVAETLCLHPVTPPPPMAGPSVSSSCASFIPAWVEVLRPHPTCSHFLPFCHLLPLIPLSRDSWKPLNRWQPWQPPLRGWAWPADPEEAGSKVGFSWDAALGGRWLLAPFIHSFTHSWVPQSQQDTHRPCPGHESVYSSLWP